LSPIGDKTRFPEFASLLAVTPLRMIGMETILIR